MNCIIVDDEPFARDEMKSMIQDISSIEISGLFSNAVDALNFLKENNVDVIFLDIEMPKVSGLEFTQQMPKDSLIIFTTAYPQYALKSYELDAIDYLLKPIDTNRLERAIQKAFTYRKLLSTGTTKNSVEASTADFLFIKSERRYFKVFYRDILFIEGLKDYVVIYTQKQKMITAMNLKTIHQRMPGNQFMRVSKSYVVNLNAIESFDHSMIYLSSYEIRLGDVYKKEFFEKYSGGI